MLYNSVLQLTAGNETIYLCIMERTKAVVGCLVAEKVSDNDSNAVMAACRCYS